MLADDVLYLKVDDVSRQRFTGVGLEPFECLTNGKPMKMSYCMVPEEV